MVIGEKLYACRLIVDGGLRHSQVHRNQQIALVLLRYGKSWNTKLAKSLMDKYYIMYNG